MLRGNNHHIRKFHSKVLFLKLKFLRKVIINNGNKLLNNHLHWKRLIILINLVRKRRLYKMRKKIIHQRRNQWEKIILSISLRKHWFKVEKGMWIVRRKFNRMRFHHRFGLEMRIIANLRKMKKIGYKIMDKYYILNDLLFIS